MLSGGHLAVEELVGVEAENLEGALAPEGVLAALDGLLGLVLDVPALALRDGALEHVPDVVGEIELPGVSRVSLHDEHLDAGEVVSFLAVLDVNRDAGLGGDGGASGDLRGAGLGRISDRNSTDAWREQRVTIGGDPGFDPSLAEGAHAPYGRERERRA